MKLIFKALLFILCFTGANAQQFEWIQTDSFAFSSNPGIPNYAQTIDPFDKIITNRFDSIRILYSNWAFGDQRIEKRDEQGTILWSYLLMGSSSTQRICTDAMGNIYIAGNYLETLYLGSTDSLVNTVIQNLNINLFIISLDPSGQLRWKKNVSVNYPDPQNIEAITCDPQGNLWYAVDDFFIGTIVKTDAQGLDLFSHTITNAKRIGSLDFDPWGNLFVGGSAEQGTFSMGTLSYQVPNPYNFFIARYDASNNPSWARITNDVTFQAPIVRTDGMGNAYMSAYLMDTCSFGNVHFTPTTWGADFFLIKTDSIGQFQWGYQLPVTLVNPTGDYTIGSNEFFDCDAAGNVYIGGTQRGTVDFGNSVISNLGAVSNERFSFLCLDASGIPQWTISGGSPDINYLHSLHLDHQTNLYFTGSVSGNCTFGTINFNLTAWGNFLLGKINLNAITGTSAIKNDDAFQFQLFPNPSAGELNIPTSMQGADIKIFNNLGALVFSRNAIDSGSMNGYFLADGLYLIQFTLNQQSSTFKWMKTKNQ